MADELVFLVELDAVHAASGHRHRFYFSTPPGYQCRRTDALADLPYVPLVEQAADVSLTIASYGGVAGASQAEVGETILSNRLDWQRRMPIRGRDLDTGGWVVLPAAARPLNALWTDYALAGRRLAVFVGPRTGRRDVDFVPVVVAGQEMPRLTRTGIVLTPRDRTVDFDTALQAETYGGTGGLDGTADMKGRTKERCFGHVLSLQPSYLGIVGGLHTFSVNGGHPIEGIVAVRDGYVDLVEATGTPAAGQWAQDKATGILRLGGGAGQNPTAYPLTCEVKGDKTGGVWRQTIADLVRFWATASGILDEPAGVDAAAFAAFAAAAPYAIGLWLPAGDTTTLRDVFDRAVQSARGFWLVDEAERLTVGQVLPAAGTPVRRLRRGIDHVGLKPLDRAGRDVPARAVLLRTGRNYAPRDAATLDRAITDDARSIATTEWRESRTPDDPGAVAAYGANIARLIERDTLLRHAADGDAEAAALLDDARVPRQLYELPCTRLFADIRRLDVVVVEDDLPGFEAGRPLRVIGVRVNQRANLSTFILRE
ncbi:hypothetical protein [Azospirillum sp. ST 5-10]|uniref:hypothetical protein n=1 Tax=unclassified Azospirillum TaxID=2630922 RepID=UPI003F4A50AD